MNFRINPIQPPSAKEKNALRLMILIGLMSMGFFLYNVFKKDVISYFPLYVLLMITMIYYCLKFLHEWYHYFSISSPEKPVGNKAYTVDIFTTYCAGEPFDMLENTLAAIQNIKYPHTAWCCDEADDPEVKQLCVKLGVRHVTRADKRDAKAGNINNALQFASGELCVILDPDHIPAPEFLNEIVAYFDDPSIGFVQVVQAYYNRGESLVAKGAAQQTYQFYGPMMMTMHQYGTVQAIGANCTFRRKALDSIGGHASGLAEDMHTAMKLHAARWRSVYVPAILTRGLVPATMSSYYKQQLKWSRGTWELLVSAYPKLFPKFSWRQKLHYFTLPFHYLCGIIFFINFLIPVVSLFTGYIPLEMDVFNFILAAFPLFAMSTLIRHYVQKWVAEEKERGFHVVGGILQIGAWWVHSVGFIYTILRKKVPYIPTPKNDHASLPFILSLPNILVGLISLVAILYGLFEDLNPYTVFMIVLAGMQIIFMLFNLAISGYHSKRGRLNDFAKKLRQNTWLITKTHGFLRRYSVPLSFLLIILFSFAYWEKQQLPRFLPKPLAGLHIFYRGIYHPNDLSKAKDASIFSAADKAGDVAILASGVPWKPGKSNELDTGYMGLVYKHRAIPLIAWDPFGENNENLVKDTAAIQHILSGKYDSTLSSFALQIAALDRSVYLRLTNEKAEAISSWFNYDGYKPEDFKAVWQYVHRKFDEAGADKVIWIWNPPDAPTAADYFPGNNYVDWLGVSVADTNPNRLATGIYGFDSLYRPYHSLQLFKSGLPVMLTNIVAPSANSLQWWDKTWQTVDSTFLEIKSVVVNSADYPMLAKSPGASIPIDATKTVSKKTFGEAQLRSFPPFKSIVYDKGYHWFRNRHTLGLRIIEEDVAAMKEIGINTIERTMPGIYDNSIEKTLISYKMNLIPRFWFPATPRAIADDRQMENQKEKILRVIKDNLDKKYIVAWNLGEDVLYDLYSQMYKPDYFYYKQKYVAWLSDVCREIRKLDSARPIIMDLHWDVNGRKRFGYYKKHVPEVNTYMLEADAKDTAALKEPLEEGMAWGQVPVELWHFIPSIGQAGTIPAWQDIETTDYVKLNGLLDLEGRKKQWFREVLKVWGNRPADPSPVPEIRILNPADVTVFNRTLVYQPVYQEGSRWQLFNEDEEKIQFEWYLVRLDQYGNTMFIDRVGKGLYLELPIPAQPEYYNLYLEAISGEDIKVVHTTLNTPFE